MLSLQVVSAAVEPVTEPATDSSGYYLIGSADDLEWFAEAVNGGQTTIKGKLTENIEFNGSDSNQWTPIGNDSNIYTGTFDGGNHTISGLYVNDSTKEYVGLFGCSGGTIQNVGVVDCTFNGKTNIGGICGKNTISVTNCYVTGKLSGSYVGGISGTNTNSITKCYTSATISGTDNLGGISGRNAGTTNNCYSTSTLSGTSQYVGGISGYNSSTISNCYATGTVSLSSTYGSVGSICGHSSTSSVRNSYYLSGTAGKGIGTGLGTSTAKTEAQFKSGEVCYLLNSNKSTYNVVWKQTIGEDDYPVFSGAIVKAYTVTGGKLYGNNSEIKTADVGVKAVDITTLGDVTIKAGVFNNCTAENIIVYVKENDTTEFDKTVTKKYVVDDGVSIDTTSGEGYKLSVVVDTTKFGGTKKVTPYLDEVDVIDNEIGETQVINYTEAENSDNIEFKVNFDNNPSSATTIRGQVKVQEWKDSDEDTPTGDTIYYVTKTHTVSTTGTVK